MVKIFKANKKSNSKGQANKQRFVEVTVDSVDHECQSVARVDDKVTFFAGALPSETCVIKIDQQNRHFNRATLQKISQVSNDRITPPCRHFDNCGGCQLQYLGHQHQLQLKQQGVDQLLRRALHLQALPWQPAIHSYSEGYRQRARFAAFYDRSKRKLIIGFRQQASKKIIALTDCIVLPNGTISLINELQQQLQSSRLARHLGHVWFHQVQHCKVLTLRLSCQLAGQDEQLLNAFSEDTQCDIWVKENDQTIRPLGDAAPLNYRLNDQFQLHYQADQFIQVNPEVNEKMVTHALDWLAVTKQDSVLDLFSGIGNFSLPLARQANQVVAIEGLEALTEQATNNAKLNQIENGTFKTADLSEQGSLGKWLQQANKVLLDPARAGADAVAQQLAGSELDAILYVSCNPATFSRDAKLLLDGGWQISKICLLDMFPHTSHVETMALFSR